MANKDYEITLKLKAEIDQALKGLNRTKQGIADVAKAATQANTDIGKVGSGGKGFDATGEAMRKTALSAGELKFATRGLPAQFTDIFTSLQGGQRPINVLLQQGGQLKDMFGGIGPAARAMGGYVAGLINPFTLAAAAIGTFGFALAKGYLEMRALDTALIATGNYAAASADQMAEMRNRFGEANGEFGKAQEALLLLTAAGTTTSSSLQSAMQAAVNLSDLTGRSIKDTTAEVEKLAKAPTAALLELNDKYHFLTLEVYDNVRSLEEQGRTTDAVRVATDALAKVTEQRVEEMRANAGILERAWAAVKREVLKTWQAIKDVGRADDAFKLQQLREGLAQKRASFGPFANGADDLEAQIKAIEKRMGQAGVAAAAAFNDEGRREAVLGAAAAVDKQLAQADKVAAKQKEINALTREFNVLLAEQARTGIANARLAGVVAGPNGPSGGAFDLLKKSIEDKYATRATGGGSGGTASAGAGVRGQDNDAAAQRELANLQKQVAMLGELEDGENKVSEAARIRYEIEQGAYKSASPALQQQLKAAAAQLDTGRQQVEIAKQLVQVRLRTAQLEGRGEEAKLAETIASLEEMRQKLLAVGKAAEAAEITRAMGLERAQVALQAATAQLGASEAGIAAESERVNIARQNGLISSVEAQRKLLELGQQRIAQLQEMIPLLEAAAAAMSGPAQDAALAKIAQLKNELFDLQTQGTLLQTTFRNAFEGGLTTAIEGFVNRTLTAKQAVLGLVADVAAGMARLAAQQLASAATAKLMSAFGKGDQGDAAGAGAAKLTVAAAATGAAGVVIQTGASSLLSAAIALQAAASTLIVANSIGSATGFAGGGFVKAATGGHITGPGTSTSDSIYARLSDGEFVARAAVVAQPGALGFLSAFNQRGMAVIDDWARRYDGAEMPRSSLPSAPRFNFASGGLAKGMAPAVSNRMRVYVLQNEDQLAERLAKHPALEKAVVVIAGENGGAIRADW